MSLCPINPHGTDHYWMTVPEPSGEQFFQKCLFCETERVEAGITTINVKGDYL